MPGNHALIFGASGVSGWAVVKNCMDYPSKTTFSRITGLTNRPVDPANWLLPQDDRLQLVSGLNLKLSPRDIANFLTTNIPDCASVTHVFFSAYTENHKDVAPEDANVLMLRNAIDSVVKIASGLKCFILQTGGKWYGVEFVGGQVSHYQVPVREDQPRILPPGGDEIFYYPQYDALEKAWQEQSNSQWSFAELRPDAILGYAPNHNILNIALALAMWLSVVRSVQGDGSEVAFPGTRKSWVNTFTHSSQDVLAKMEIYVALKAGEGLTREYKSFNAVDGPSLTRWCEIWPEICQRFGLVGIGPPEDEEEAAKAVEAIPKFMKDHDKEWKALVAEHGLQSGDWPETCTWGFMGFILVLLNFDRQCDVSRSRAIGFNEVADSMQGYDLAFERMRQAKMIP